MRRAAAGVAAAVALAVPAVARATVAHDATVARHGVAVGLQRHWLKAADAQRYRSDIARAVRDTKQLPPLRADIVASQLSQLTPLASSYVAPRALTLFAQLEANMDYLETNALPDTQIDITDDDGVVYRWYFGKGFEFHPLANFGALNTAAAAGNADAASTLAQALLARAIPHGRRLVWEYEFHYGIGRAPWASGMAQAVAAQALARTASLLEDTSIAAAAVRAYASVPPFLLSLSSGPWIRLYGFDSEIVLNAQLQTILSLLDYAQSSGDQAASALAAQLTASTQKLFPRFDTGDWSRYELGGGYASLGYQKFVTDLLRKLAAKTDDPFWTATSQRFHAYFYDPPQVTQAAPPATVWPQPADGYLDTTSISLTLSMRASVSVAVAGKVATYRWAPGTHTLTWKPPDGLQPGTYPVQVSAVSYAGHRQTFTLAPVVVQWDSQPPPLTATFDGTTLSWQSTDAGTPWLDLAVDLVDPTGVNPPQTIELGRLATAGSMTLTLPPGTWQATLRAMNSAALTAPYLLGTFIGAG